MNLRRAVYVYLIAAAFSGLPPTVLAVSDIGPYLTGSLGAALPDSADTTASVTATPTATNGSAHFGAGFAGSITPGFAMGENFRSDLELSYRDKPGNGGGIDEKAYSALANLWVDILHQYGYFIYFGAGLGAARVDLHSSDGSDSALPLVWQVGAGTGVTLTSRWALSTDFRRISAFDKSSFEIDGNENLKMRYTTSAVTLSLRYSFGGMSAPLLDRMNE